MKDKIYREKGGSSTEFYPSGEVTRILLSGIMPDKRMVLLDPCAGACGLTIDERLYNYKYYNFDLDPKASNVKKADFLKDKLELEEPIDAVVMNPPFGQLDEFVSKAFEYSPHLYLVGPYKTVLKKYAKHVKQCLSTVKLFKDFPIYTSVGIFELDRDYEDGKAEQFKDKKIPYCLDKIAIWTDKHTCTTKPFVVIRITKSRICRNEDLVKDSDIHEAGEDVFKAECANVSVKAGDSVKRSIVYCNSVEDCKRFKAWYDANQESLREYLYRRTGNLPNLSDIPAPLGFENNFANFNTF